MPAHYFKSNQFDESFHKLLFFSGLKPTPFIPARYTDKQAASVIKQFKKTFKNWERTHPITYTASQYLKAVKKHLSDILQLPLEQRKVVVKKLNQLLPKHKNVAALSEQITSKLSWMQLHNYFHHIPPDKFYSTDLVASSLNKFNEQIMVEAMNDDLFDLKNSHHMLLSPVTFILKHVRDHFAIKAFFKEAIKQPLWLEIITNAFKIDLGSFYLTGSESRIHCSEDIPGEDVMEKLLAAIQQNPLVYQDNFPVFFTDRLKGHLQFNPNFAKYLTEQAILYASFLSVHEKIEFYPPLQNMIETYGLTPLIEDMRTGKKPLFYIPNSALQKYVENYYPREKEFKEMPNSNP